MPLTLTDCGFNRSEIMECGDDIATAALADACTAANPRTPTADDIKNILNQIA